VDTVERFLGWHRGLNHSEHTVRSYGLTVRALERALPDFVSASRAEIREALPEVVAGAPTSRNQKLAAIKSFYAWAVEEAGLRDDDPVGKMRGASLPRLLPKALTDQTVQALLTPRADSAEDRRNTAVVATLLATGLRLAELCQLDVADVQGRRIHVVGKGQKERVVFLNKDARAALDRWLLCRMHYRPQDDALFIGFKGRLGPDGVEQIVAERGGAEHVTPHMLRHTFATRMARQKVPLEVIRRMMGHTSSVTTQRYIDLVADDLERSYREAMGEEA
jgi:integrase/recombinase XerC